MRQFTPRWIAAAAITSLLLYLVWQLFLPFVNVVLWSIMLSVIAAPVNHRLRSWGWSANLSALLMLIAMLVVLIIPSVLVIRAAVGHGDEAVDAVVAGYAKLTDPDSAMSHWIQDNIPWLAKYVNIKELLTKQNLAAQIMGFKDVILRQGYGLVGNVVLVVVQFFLVLFTTFYLLRDGRKLMEGVRVASPLTRTQTDTLVAHTRTIISASLQGTVLIAAIQGVLGGIAFWLVGIPAALLWMPVMFMTSLIPIVGSSIIWGPAALYLLAGGSWGKALFLTIWGLGVIGMIDNVLRPILVGSRTRMHELVVLFSVLGGLQFFGPVGIVVGPMTVAAAQGLMRIFIDEAAEAEKS